VPPAVFLSINDPTLEQYPCSSYNLSAFNGRYFPSDMQHHCDNAPEATCSKLEEEKEGIIY
jgi:hypothetical protein